MGSEPTGSEADGSAGWQAPADMGAGEYEAIVIQQVLLRHLKCPTMNSLTRVSS